MYFDFIWAVIKNVAALGHDSHVDLDLPLMQQLLGRLHGLLHSPADSAEDRIPLGSGKLHSLQVQLYIAKYKYSLLKFYMRHLRNDG